MGRGKLQSRLVIALAVIGAIAPSCGGSSRGAEEEQPPVKKSGTLNSADYVRPRIDRPNAFLVPRCCTLAIGQDAVERLSSDSFVAVIGQEGWRAEVLFGFNEASPSRENMRPALRKVIDGIPYHRFDLPGDGANESGARYIWSADVPLANDAEAKGVVRPALRIDGTCRTAAACRQLIATMNTIRF
ncbi:MAG TPA: hypothetical protein VF662_09495 [Allosphingosinicella sp.]